MYLSTTYSPFLVISVIIIVYIHHVYLKWLKGDKNSEDSGKYDRSDEKSPSHRSPPVTSTSASSLSQFAERTLSFEPSFFESNIETLQDQDKKLDMDHVRVPLSMFLLAYTFLGGLNLQICALLRLLKLKLRMILSRNRIISHQSYEAEAVAAKLILETALSIYYVPSPGMYEKKIASFVYENVQMVVDKGVHVTGRIDVDVDLQTGTMIMARCNNELLDADEVITILFFYLVSQLHPKEHSMANWAVNIEPSHMQHSPFHFQNSLVTVMYNHYGYKGFPTNISFFQNLGLMSQGFDEMMMKSIFDGSLEESIPEHSSIRDLAPYSRLIHFITKLRPHFLRKFNKVKHLYFPACHGEALLAQTVIHSLDHASVAMVIKDELWFNTNHEKFGLMAECNRLIRGVFIDELSCLMFTKSFKDSDHEFYKDVYNAAKRIDNGYCDLMDTCIIR